MFNEIDHKVLEEALLNLRAQAPTRMAFEIGLENLIEALDRAGVCGLVHDGSRVAREAKSAA